MPVFSSPELNAQAASLSDHLSHVRLSVCKLFTFSSYSPKPLGKYFNQTWHNASLGDGDSMNDHTFFSKGDYNEIAKNNYEMTNCLIRISALPKGRIFATFYKIPSSLLVLNPFPTNFTTDINCFYQNDNK